MAKVKTIAMTPEEFPNVDNNFLNIFNQFAKLVTNKKCPNAGNVVFVLDKGRLKQVNINDRLDLVDFVELVK